MQSADQTTVPCSWQISSHWVQAFLILINLLFFGMRLTCINGACLGPLPFRVRLGLSCPLSLPTVNSWHTLRLEDGTHTQPNTRLTSIYFTPAHFATMICPSCRAFAPIEHVLCEPKPLSLFKPPPAALLALRWHREFRFCSHLLAVTGRACVHFP